VTDTPEQAARAARDLVETVLSGALATVRRQAKDRTGAAGVPGGHPYVSKVGVAVDTAGTPIFLFSTLAAHTQDLLADPRASLLVEAAGQGGGNPLEAARVTLVGQAQPLQGEAAKAARAMYLARHSSAKRYVDFGDFAFWSLSIEKVHYVGGFGQAKWIKGVLYRDVSR